MQNAKCLTKFSRNFESVAVQKVQKHVNLVDLVRASDPNSNEYLLAKFGVDTAENEPLKVWRKFQFIFHSPP